jgi:GNAT superfamily N-acetyltransferase
MPRVPAPVPSESTEFSLQPARDEHVPALAALWAEAFPEKPAGQRARELREGLPYGDLGDCWFVDLDGRMAGALRTYRLTMHFWGHEWPTMGLAGVAVAPDFRRRGIGRQMCIASLRMARERGDVLSALYPFRTSFYRDLGYALVGSLHRYRFAGGDLSLEAGWERVERALGTDEARAVYDRVAVSSNGLLARTERMWSFLDAEGTHLYVHRDAARRATGYVVVRGRAGRPDRSRLVVKELLALDPEAYQSLLGWLAVQRDQWRTIVYDALPGEDFHRRLGHPRSEGFGGGRGLWFTSARLLRGPMLRILDPGPLLAPDGPPLQLRDPQLPDNGGRWQGGSRVDATPASDEAVLSMSEASALFVEGRLAGQKQSPEGWRPNLGLTDMRLYDEF